MLNKNSVETIPLMCRFEIEQSSRVSCLAYFSCTPRASRVHKFAQCVCSNGVSLLHVINPQYLLIRILS
uniref:Uncharacterized protein n=1 Tax=Hyaloperonospora arabidopsidis (strain Emoy2) TaxID=559515 RepID=M4BWC4_HYAAE